MRLSYSTQKIVDTTADHPHYGMLELVLAKEIVELHEGRLSFYEEDDKKGFQIQLPAVFIE